VKKEFQEDKPNFFEPPEPPRDFGDTGDDNTNPRKKARRKAVVACDFCKGVFILASYLSYKD
jgi:hypothetical protein